MGEYRHIFFDLDGTLMRSRAELLPEHESIFRGLCTSKDVIVVSGATAEQMEKQIGALHEGQYYKLSQYGNHALQKSGGTLWKEQFNKEQEEAVYSFIARLQKELALSVSDPKDLVEHRGSQISYSLIGHNEDLQKKYTFDPGSSRRKALLLKHKDEVKKLLMLGVAVGPGGTTCLDFTLAGHHKGFNVIRLIEKLGWHKEDALYIGDELEPGRNDETVLGVIDTHAVKNPDETFAFVKSKLLL